jgi:hypothetical protein
MYILLADIRLVYTSRRNFALWKYGTFFCLCTYLALDWTLANAGRDWTLAVGAMIGLDTFEDCCLGDLQSYIRNKQYAEMSKESTYW